MISESGDLDVINISKILIVYFASHFFIVILYTRNELIFEIHLTSSVLFTIVCAFTIGCGCKCL